MKKILFLIFAQIVLITAIAQQPQVYTLDLQDGSFLLKQNGNTIIRPEKVDNLFVVNADTLFIDTIIVSNSNSNSKSFVVKDSEKSVMEAQIKKNINVGEKGFDKQLQLVTGNYNITWGNVSWKIELRPEVQLVEEERIALEQEEDAQSVKSTLSMEEDDSEQEDEKVSPWEVAFFSLLIVIIVGFLIGQWKNIRNLFKKQTVKKSFFNVVENGFSLDLAAFAKQNKKKVNYDGNLTLKEGISPLVISINNNEQIKGNRLKIILASPSVINTAVYYDGDSTAKMFCENEKQNTVIYDIEGEQYIKTIKIVPVGQNNSVVINALTVETVRKHVENVLRNPNQGEENVKKEQKVDPKVEPLFSEDFQQSLLAMFSASDDYKDLDENARLELLKQDLNLAGEQKKTSSKPQEDKELENKEKEKELEIRNKENQEIEQTIVSWIKQNKYVLSLFQHHNEKKESFWDILKELLAKEITEPKQSTVQDIPLSERLRKKNIDDVTAVKTFILNEYIKPLKIEQLSTISFDAFKKSLKEFFDGINDGEEQTKEEPKDMVKELVNNVNLQLPEDKRLNLDDVEQQLITRLALPTDFDEAELKVWKKVAEVLKTDMVDAETLEGVIDDKVQSKFDEELLEKLEDKENAVKEQDLKEMKDGLSDIVDEIEDCKTIANVMQKVKGQINGARDRENNAINNIRNAYREQVGKDLPKSIELKEAIKLYKKDVPESVRDQEWERISDTINSLGFGETNTVSEATLPSALNTYYEGRLQKEVTSQLNEHLKADRKDTKTMVNELNKALDVANEAETLCLEYKADSVSAVRDKLVNETEKMEEEKKEVEKQKQEVERDRDNRAQVISATVDSMHQQLTTSVKELGKLLSKAGYMKPCSNDDEEGEKVAEHNQDALIERYDSLSGKLLTALPADVKDITPGEAKAKVQAVLEDDLAKAFQNKDLSQFSVIDKITRYYAYSRLPFMTENAQEADISRSLRSYGVVFNRSRMTAIYAQVNQLLSDFGLQLVVPTLFAERLGEGHYNRSSQDGDLAILCPHPEYWKQTIANADKKDVIIDIAATGYCKDGKLIKETEVIINNN